MQTKISGFRLAGIATALPSKRVTIASMGSRFGEDYVQRASQSTGIVALRLAKGQKASDLAYEAAKRLFEELNIDTATIDAVIFVTQTPDHIAPPTAPSLQHRLGISTEAVTYDIGYGCSGYVVGLYHAAMLLAVGGCHNVLLLAGDVISPYVNPEDKALSMVIGDGVTASLVTRGDGQSGFVINGDGSGVKSLWIPAGGSVHPKAAETATASEQPDGSMRALNDLHMDGLEVMMFALKTVPPTVRRAMEEMGWQKEDVDKVVFHQANKLIVESVGKKLKLEPEQYPIALEETGNTGPASIPIALSVLKARGEDFSTWHKCIFCGFGIGLSYCSVALDVSQCVVLPPFDVS